jgi:hypothetical protein
MQLLEGVKMLAAQGGGWSIQVLIFQCCRSESGIRCLFDPWIRDQGWNKIQIQDPGEDLVSKINFGLKIQKLFYGVSDPGSGMEKKLR